MDFESIISKKNPTKEEAQVIAKAFWNLVKKYELTHDEVMLLFGKNFDPKTIAKFKESSSLPEGHDAMIRAIHILGIHNSLRVVYPHNPSLVYSWMKHKESNLKNLSPLEFIKESGIKSLSAIIFLRNLLDYKRTAL